MEQIITLNQNQQEALIDANKFRSVNTVSRRLKLDKSTILLMGFLLPSLLFFGLGKWLAGTILLPLGLGLYHIYGLFKFAMSINIDAGQSSWHK